MPLAVYTLSPSRTLLAARVERAVSFGARLRGLLGRDGLAPDEGLLIEPCSSIHTFFMRFAIDVAFLDDTSTVVRAISGVAPWRATRVYLNARSVLELPKGRLAACGVREGDRLVFEESSATTRS